MNYHILLEVMAFKKKKIFKYYLSTRIKEAENLKLIMIYWKKHKVVNIQNKL